MGVVKSRWASWSSKPVAGRVAGRGGFDSHPLSPILGNRSLTTPVLASGASVDHGSLSMVYRLFHKLPALCIFFEHPARGRELDLHFDLLEAAPAAQ